MVPRGDVVEMVALLGPPVLRGSGGEVITAREEVVAVVALAVVEERVNAAVAQERLGIDSKVWDSVMEEASGVMGSQLVVEDVDGEVVLSVEGVECDLMWVWAAEWRRAAGLLKHVRGPVAGDRVEGCWVWLWTSGLAEGVKEKLVDAALHGADVEMNVVGDLKAAREILGKAMLVDRGHLTVREFLLTLEAAEFGVEAGQSLAKRWIDELAGDEDEEAVLRRGIEQHSALLPRRR